MLGDRAPTMDDLRALPLALGAVQEVLRMWPPGPAAPRMSIAPSELHGMTIPAGRMVLYSAYVTGRLPELWPDPERFDPTRWAPGAPEPKPYSFVPVRGRRPALHRVRPRHPRAAGDGRPPGRSRSSGGCAAPR